MEEIASCGAGREVTVRVVTVRQGDDAYAQAVLMEALSQSLSRALSGLVVVLIKGKVDRAITVVVQLSQCAGVK